MQVIDHSIMPLNVSITVVTANGQVYLLLEGAMPVRRRVVYATVYWMRDRRRYGCAIVVCSHERVRYANGRALVFGEGLYDMKGGDP